MHKFLIILNLCALFINFMHFYKEKKNVIKKGRNNIFIMWSISMSNISNFLFNIRKKLGSLYLVHCSVNKCTCYTDERMTIQNSQHLHALISLIT